MKKNTTFLGRWSRILLGMTMVAWATAGGPGWAFFGLIAIFTGCLGYSPIISFIDYRRNKIRY